MWTPEQANQSIRTAQRNAILADVARVIANTLPTETLADVLNGWLTVRDDEQHDERTADIAGRLFDQLCELCPLAVDMAQSR